MALWGAGKGDIPVLKRLFAPSMFVILLLLLSASVSQAEIQGRIRVIQASNVGSVIDSSLRDVHSELGSLFSFTSYRLLKDINLRLVGNQPVEIPVHGGRSLEITLAGEYRNLAELKIRLRREGMVILNTQVRLASGRTILIGGPRHGDGVIILALSANF